jgi:hypothetical protein
MQLFSQANIGPRTEAPQSTTDNHRVTRLSNTCSTLQTAASQCPHTDPQTTSKLRVTERKQNSAGALAVMYKQGRAQHARRIHFTHTEPGKVPVANPQLSLCSLL